MEQEAKKIRSIFTADRLRGIEHYGSTSVPGLSAKPIVDMLIGLNEFRLSDEELTSLKKIGYEFIGQLHPTVKRFYLRKRGPINYNLGVVVFDTQDWHNHLNMRDYLRTHPDSIITDAQMPDILEAIIAKCGGTPVYYTERDCCCGAGITQRHTNPDLSLEVSYQKMKSLSKDPPDLLLSICPFCMSTLENCQFNIEIEKDLELSIPVLHVSELIALVLGFDPIADLSLDSHTINPIPALKNISPIENT